MQSRNTLPNMYGLCLVPRGCTKEINYNEKEYIDYLSNGYRQTNAMEKIKKLLTLPCELNNSNHTFIDNRQTFNISNNIYNDCGWQIRNETKPSPDKPISPNPNYISFLGIGMGICINIIMYNGNNMFFSIYFIPMRTFYINRQN
jgi:hypothetical protein